jgi:hypothetical protein
VTVLGSAGVSATADVIERLRADGTTVIVRHRMRTDTGTKVETVEYEAIDSTTAEAVNAAAHDVILDNRGRVWVMSPVKAHLRVGVIGKHGDNPLTATLVGKKASAPRRTAATRKAAAAKENPTT